MRARPRPWSPMPSEWRSPTVHLSLARSSTPITGFNSRPGPSPIAPNDPASCPQWAQSATATTASRQVIPRNRRQQSGDRNVMFRA
jgi:hypothetical protein